MLRLLILVGPLPFARPASSQHCIPREGGKTDTVEVYASAALDPSDTDPIRVLRGTVLQQYVIGFPAINSVILPGRALAGMPGHPVPTGGGGAKPFAEVHFTLHSDGRVSGIRLAVASTDPPLDSAMIGTARGLDSAHAPFYSGEQLDTLPMRIQLSVNGGSGALKLHILNVWEPIVRDRAAKLRPSSVYPKWPKELEDARIGDDVVIQFRVSKEGRALTDSVRVIEGKHKQYIDAVIAVLPSYRWTPAIVGGCPAVEWTQMPFMFHFK